MRPIKLKIKGLNSYKEEQIVDFEKLLASGVFGIFGPTGSGKSTILDGITIALYGHKAIPRDTSDFINTDSEKAYVYFEFQLVTFEGREGFVIERSFKENKTGGIATDFARLYRVKGEEREIIEDKVNSINKSIEEILGLKSDDFLRSVVLPQGKFSEFLKLKNKERCDMLERILNLQEYGERLSRKIAENRNTIKIELSSKQGELKRYDGISEEALRELKKEYDTVTASIVKLQQDIDIYTKTIEESKIILTYQDELLQNNNKLDKLLGREKEIISLKQDNENYDKALVIKPIRDELLKRRKERDVNEKRSLELKVQIDNSQIEVKNIEKELKEIEIWQKECLPKKNRFEIKLEEVINHEAELKTLVEERKQQVAHYKEAEKHIKDATDRLNKDTIELNELNERITSLDERLKELVVDNKYRTRVLEGINLVKILKKSIDIKVGINNEIKNLILELGKDEEKYKIKTKDSLKLKDSLMDIDKTIEELEAKAKMLGSELIELRDKNISLSYKIKDIDKDIINYHKLKKIFDESKKNYDETTLKIEFNDRKADKNAQALEVINTDLETLKNSLLAGTLAKDLKENNPCPVCGSLEHPQVAENVESEEINRLEQLKKDFELEKQEILESKNNLNLDMSKAKHRMDVTRRDMDDIEPKVQGIDIEALKLEAEKINGDIGLKKKALKDVEDVLPVTIKKRKDVNESYELLNRESNDLLLGIETKRAMLRDKKSRMEEQETITQEHQTQINIIKDELKIDDIERALISINEKDKAYEEISLKYKKSKERFTKLQDEIKGQEEILRVNKSKLDIAIEIGKERAKDIEVKKELIFAVTKGEGAKGLLDKVKKEISEFEARYQNLKKRLQDSSLTIDKNRGSYNSLLGNIKVLDEIIQGKDKELKLKLIEFDMEDISVVLKDVITAITYEDNKAELKYYNDDLGVINANISRLSKSLDGKSCDKEAYKELELKLKKSLVENKNLLEVKGSVSRKVEDMEKSLEILLKLLEEEKVLERRLGMLNELFTLIKGKKFVEFIAINRLKYISREASKRLMSITNNRFSLELDSKGGFIICDNYNGGVRRDSNSLSGGETFLTSLALALSLSSHIQLKSTSSIEFFFMDEGFGTLDNQLLDMVMSSLEKLGEENLSVGIISHVKEIRDRVETRLVVDPAEAGVKGTTLRIEV